MIPFTRNTQNRQIHVDRKQSSGYQELGERVMKTFRNQIPLMGEQHRECT